MPNTERQQRLLAAVEKIAERKRIERDALLAERALTRAPTIEERILQEVLANPGLGCRAFAKRIGVSEKTVRDKLALLRDKELVFFISSRRGSRGLRVWWYPMPPPGEDLPSLETLALGQEISKCFFDPDPT